MIGALALVTGLVSGFVNTVAGGGSALNLPLLVLLGLSPDVANGTNRVAIVLQSSVAVATFLRRGVLGSPAPPRALANLGLPLLLGAAVGAGLASLLDPDWFRKILGLVLLMLGVDGLSRIRHRGGGDAGAWRAS